jgi:hypothetical protein
MSTTTAQIAQESEVKTADKETLARWVDETLAHPEEWIPGPGRPRVGNEMHGPTATRTVRIPDGIDKALKARAAADDTTPSEVIRRALVDYLVRRIAQDGADPVAN